MTLTRTICIILTVLTASCASRQVPQDFPEALLQGEAGRVVQVANGELFSPRSALETIAQSTVIYVAERHDEQAHHQVQLLVAEGLMALGYTPVLGFEMLQREDQAALDSFLAGRIPEDIFLEKVKWASNWGYPYRLYRPLFQLARTHGLRGFALNAPRALVRAVAKKGKDGLPPHLAKVCPPLDSGTKAHRAYIKGFFQGHGGHGSSGGNFDNFYSAQLVWDETMAKRVRDAQSTLDSRERLLVFAGRGHIDHAHGIPSRATTDGTDFSIVRPIKWGQLYKHAKELRVLSYPAKTADWLWESSRPRSTEDGGK